MEKHVWKVEPKRSVGPVKLRCLLSSKDHAEMA